MFRRKVVASLAAAILVLSMIPEVHAASATVHITARVRAKVSVTIEPTEEGEALRVRANIPWTISTNERGPGGVAFGESFSGSRTTDSGTLVPTIGQIERFTVLAVP